MIFLALNYLISRKKQTFFTLLGIFFGAFAYVAISGLMLGFREYLIEQLVNNTAQVHIQAREDFLEEHQLDQAFYRNSSYVFWEVSPSGRLNNAQVENPGLWYERLKSDPRVLAYTPQLSSVVLFSKGSAQASGTLVGCDPLQQVKVTTIGDSIVEGKWSDLLGGGNRLVMGAELKKKLGVKLSQIVLISLAQADPSPFKVVAFFKTGNKSSDTQAYGVIADVQRVNETPNRVNEIGVRLEDSAQAASLASDWSLISPERVESWDQQNANFFDVFRVQDIFRYLSVSTVLLVSAFGIYNILNMTVMQKRRDIAILKSMGYTPNDIVFLFFSQGLILGLLGAFFGLLAGYCLSLYLQTIAFGGGPMGSGPGHLMVSMNSGIYIQACLLAVCSSCFASILPARAAGKLTPIEIIRAGTD